MYKKHGLSYNPLYYVWSNMIARCTNENHPRYKDYGARGILVCKDWEDVSVFIIWAETHGYEKGLLLDRKDNDGNYEPSNCRFITRIVSNNNQRGLHIITHNGKTQTLSLWAKELNINVSTLHYRLETWPVEKALTTPHRYKAKQQLTAFN